MKTRDRRTRIPVFVQSDHTCNYCLHGTPSWGTSWIRSLGLLSGHARRTSTVAGEPRLGQLRITVDRLNAYSIECCRESRGVGEHTALHNIFCTKYKEQRTGWPRVTHQVVTSTAPEFLACVLGCCRHEIRLLE
jgi:hypothetical protein